MPRYIGHIPNYTTSTPTTSYSNSGGTGDRTSSITVSSNITWDSGTNSNFVDGATGNNSTDSVDTPGTIAVNDYVQFDFGSGNKVYIDEIKSRAPGYPSTNIGDWDIEASNNGSSWTSQHSSWTLAHSSGESTQAFTPTSDEGFRYWRIKKVTSSASVNIWWAEIEFKIAPGSDPATGIFSMDDVYKSFL